MRRRFVILILAALLALVIGLTSQAIPVEQKLIRIHTIDKLGDFPNIEQESIDLQAALADMTHDPLLILKAKAALLRYGDMSRQLLPMYGSDPEFQQILRQHGESVLPAIQYFVTNPISSLEWMNKAGNHYDAFTNWIKNKKTDAELDDNKQISSQPLTPSERGWHAIQYIRLEGNDFIGQFVVNPNGEVERLVSERVLEGVTQFFGSGLRQLETRYRLDEQIRASDIGWASLDVLVFASAVKVLRVGRTVAVSTRTASRGTRSAALTARLIGGGRLVLNGARYAKWPLLLGASYLVIAHPSLINDFLAEVAELIGVPAWLFQVIGWFIILLPVLYMLHALVWLITPFLQVALWGVSRCLALISGRPNANVFSQRIVDHMRSTMQRITRYFWPHKEHHKSQ